MTQIGADLTLMNADSRLTEIIIGAAYAVHNELGTGFLEAVYQRALAVELGRLAINVSIEVPLAVYYKGVNVGDYRADLLVEDEVIIEVKATDAIAPVHEQQLLHYLHATKRPLGLIVNFGRSVTVRRKVVSKNQRQSASNLR